MCSLKLRYESRKAFTLVELLLFMAISSMLMLTLFSVLTFHLRASERILLEDQMLLNGRYCIEYVKEEIANADRIILSHHFSGLDKNHPTNIGFVIANFYYNTNKDDGKIDTSYNYSTFYFKNNKLIRIATDNFTVSTSYPYYGLFSGYNELSEGVLKDSKITLEENDLVKFDLSLGENKKEISKFKTTITLRCPVVR